MKDRELPIWISFLISITVFLFACTPDTYFHENKIETVNTEYLVSRQTAEILANNILFTEDFDISGKGLSRRSSKKQIESILEVPDDENQTAYFIINYEDGGFVILAGDKRSEPVLAFSEVNKFDLDSDYFPGGLVSWLYNSKESIQSIREENIEIVPQIEKQWDNLFQGETNVVSYQILPDPINPDDPIAGINIIDPVDPECDPYTIQIGPFLQTAWGQECGYNAMTPTMSCGPCGHAFTGCVATAMAQVMRYHEYPTNYNWSGMPNASGSDEIARLMRDIGVAVDMDYQCNGSEASTSSKAAPAFKNSFGYSSASYADYNYQTVKNELNKNRPVILRGGRESGWWIFSQYKDGHAWVCDGYLNYIDPCWGSMLKFHMNWGWDRGGFNGWYNFDNFNPGDHTFNYKTGMVYNIKP